MTFQKGQSGNPRGRPKRAVEEAKHSVLLDLFDEQAETEVIKNMIALAKLRTESASTVQAATWLWDRKYGKVKDQVELYGDIIVKGYVSISPDEWDTAPEEADQPL